MANQSRPGRRNLRDKIKAGDEWHNNLVKLTASYVADSWSDEEILAQAHDLTNDGYTAEDTRKEMQKAIDGARAKGFDRGRQGTLALPAAGNWSREYDAFDARSIPRRRWIYGSNYIRGYVSVLASAGGIGKTSLQVAEALAIITGRELLDETVHESCRVWLINLEDPMEEMQLRVTATMQSHGIVQEDVQG